MPMSIRHVYSAGHTHVPSKAERHFPVQQQPAGPIGYQVEQGTKDEGMKVARRLVSHLRLLASMFLWAGRPARRMGANPQLAQIGPALGNYEYSIELMLRVISRKFCLPLAPVCSTGTMIASQGFSRYATRTPSSVGAISPMRYPAIAVDDTVCLVGKSIVGRIARWGRG